MLTFAVRYNEKIKQIITIFVIGTTPSKNGLKVRVRGPKFKPNSSSKKYPIKKIDINPGLILLQTEVSVAF
jgi:hypothetical protein